MQRPLFRCSMIMQITITSPICTICYDLSQEYVQFIVRRTYDSDLQCAKISLKNIVSEFTNTVSDNLTILQVNST